MMACDVSPVAMFDNNISSFSSLMAQRFLTYFPSGCIEDLNIMLQILNLAFIDPKSLGAGCER